MINGMHGSRGVGSRPDGEITDLKTFCLFVFVFFLVLNLFYSSQKGLNSFITEKTIYILIQVTKHAGCRMIFMLYQTFL